MFTRSLDFIGSKFDSSFEISILYVNSLLSSRNFLKGTGEFCYEFSSQLKTICDLFFFFFLEMAEPATPAVTPVETPDVIEQPSGEVLQAASVANETPNENPRAPVGETGEVHSEAQIIPEELHIAPFLKLRLSASLKAWRIWLPRQEWNSSLLCQRSLEQNNKPDRFEELILFWVKLPSKLRRQGKDINNPGNLAEWSAITKAKGYGKCLRDWILHHSDCDYFPFQNVDQEYIIYIQKIVRFDCEHYCKRDYDRRNFRELRNKSSSTSKST